MWRNEPDPRDPTLHTKVLYQAIRPSRHAKSTDPRTWAPFHVAATAAQNSYERLDGIGFVATNGPYWPGDLDDCARPGVDRIGSLDDLLPEARKLVELLNSYTEVTPSGRGVRPILRIGPAGFPEQQQCKYKGYHGFDVEIYGPSSARYYTLTGQHLPGTPTAIRTDTGEIATMLELLEQARQGARPRSASNNQTDPGLLNQADPEWPEAEFQRAWAIRHRLIDNGMPRFLPPNGQSALVLRALNSDNSDTRRTALERLEQAHPHLARALSDRSLMRRVVMRGLRTYAGYPLGAAAAVMWALFSGHAERRGRGQAWFRAEILRLWRDAQPAKQRENPSIRKMLDQAEHSPPERPPRLSERPRSAAPCPRTRSTRSTVDSPTSYLEWLRGQASGSTVVLSARAVAEALGLSLRTIRRYEASLRTAGQIERRALDRRQAGCVVLLDQATGRGDSTAAPAAQPAAGDVVIGDAVLRIGEPTSERSGEEVTRGLLGPTSAPPAPAPVGVSRAAPSGELVGLDLAVGLATELAGLGLADLDLAGLDLADELRGPGGAVVVAGGAAWVPPVAERWYAQLVERLASVARTEADDQAEELAEQHQLVPAIQPAPPPTAPPPARPPTPAATSTRRKRARCDDPNRLQGRIYAAERKAAKLERGSAAERRQARAIRAEVNRLRGRLAAVLELLADNDQAEAGAKSANFAHLGDTGCHELAGQGLPLAVAAAQPPARRPALVPRATVLQPSALPAPAGQAAQIEAGPPVLAQRDGPPPEVIAPTLGSDLAAMHAAHAACEAIRARMRERGELGQAEAEAG